MSKREMIFAAVGAAVGGAVGFTIGFKIVKKKVEKNSQEKLDREMKQVNDLEESLRKQINKLDEESNDFETENDIPEETYNDYSNLIKEEDVEVEPGIDDICEEEIKVVETPPAKHRKPRVLKRDDSEEDPGFYKEDVYYYMSNELLLDSDGNILNETDTIGNDLRRYGFLQGQGSADEVMVRNYDLETDYIVHRRSCAPEDDFEFMEEQDE